MMWDLDPVVTLITVGYLTCQDSVTSSVKWRSLVYSREPCSVKRDNSSLTSNTDLISLSPAPSISSIQFLPLSFQT